MNAAAVSIALRAFDGARYNFDADDLAYTVCHGKTDASCTRIQVEQQLVALKIGNLTRLRVEKLGRAVIDLIKGRGGDFKLYPGKRVKNIVSAEECIIGIAENDIGVVTVDIDENTDGFGEGRADAMNEFLAMRQALIGQDKTDELSPEDY